MRTRLDARMLGVTVLVAGLLALPATLCGILTMLFITAQSYGAGDQVLALGAPTSSLTATSERRPSVSRTATATHRVSTFFSRPCTFPRARSSRRSVST